MNLCLWCDAPCGEQKLCPECKAVNDHPPFHCQKGLGHLATLGDRCAECQFEEERRARVEQQNAPAVASLRKILADHVRDLCVPWKGCEFGKAHFGNMVLSALADLGCDKKDELRRAIEAAKAVR